jgi:general secretion pathway protein D
MNQKHFFYLQRVNLTIISIALAAVLVPKVFSQETPSSGTPAMTTSEMKEKALASSQSSEAEVIRRQELVIRSQILIRDAENEMTSGNYSSAIPKYEEAQRILPASPATSAESARINDGLAVANYRLGQQAYENGNYADARSYLQRSLAANPGSKEAQALNRRVEENYKQDSREKEEVAARTPAVVSDPEFRRKQDRALELFYLAEDYAKSGQYDEAETSLKEVLKIDPYSATAYHRLREVQKEKLQKYRSMKLQLETQAQLQVTERWLTHAKPTRQELGGDAGEGPIDETGRAKIMEKLRDIRIKRIEFENATIDAAVKFLADESRRADPGPEPKGVNIVLRLTGGNATPAPAAPGEPAAADVGGRRINLILNDVELGRALTFLTQVADLKYLVTEGAVVVYDGIPTNNTQIKTFSVAPGVFRGVAPEKDAAGDESRGGGFVGFKPEDMKTGKIDVKPIFESFGIEFPGGTSISYNEALGLLVVRHTPDVIDQIETILLKLNRTPRQVTIETRFLDIRQDMLNELGFHWFVKGNGVFGSNNTGFGGGSDSTGVGLPFLDPGDQVGSQRSAAADLVGSALDTLIAATSGTNPVSSVLQIANIINDPNWGVIIDAIDRKGGANLLQAPRVTTLSGEQAQILVTREFIYPSTFTDPQIVAGTATSGGSGGSAFVGPSPSEFTTREVGVVLNVRPTVGDDEYTVSMTLTPEVVDFEGFIQYGGVASISTAAGASTILFSIPQPLFAKRTVSTSVVCWDGQTVVLGGLITEDEKKFDDRVPFVGDLPVIGRLFQSKGTINSKRNLMIFVTPTIVDPAGAPIRAKEAAIKLPGVATQPVIAN